MLLLLWVMPAYMAAYPLVAVAGSELWPRPVLASCLLVGPLVPGALLVASIALLLRSKRELERDPALGSRPRSPER